DGQQRDGGGLHADRQSGDNVGGVAGGRGGGDGAHRPELRAGEELGDADQDHGDADADDGTPEQIERAEWRPVEVALAVEEHGGGEEGGQGDDHRGTQPLVERAHDPAAAGQAHEVGADHGGDDADGTED